MKKEEKDIKKLEKSYDDFPYKSKIFSFTQPLRMKTNLQLLGFETPDLEKARILEIGCSFGGNIIPFAVFFPNSEVIGVDLSKNQVDEGNRIIASMELDNIKLLHKNILEVDENLGMFDYIICHGVYSWVPDVVKDGIMKFISEHLSENGAAIISYNTYPGWKNVSIARDSMLFRSKMIRKRGQEFSGVHEELQYGRGILEFLKENSNLNNVLKEEIDQILKKKDNHYIVHEYYEHFNDPCYIYDFNEKLNGYGLSHVIDTEIIKSFPNYLNNIAEIIENECGQDYVAREQYNDFLTNCKFRTSIITHSKNIEKINISKNINISDIMKLHFRPFLKVFKENYIKSLGITDLKKRKVAEKILSYYPENVNVDMLEKDFVDKISRNEICSTIMSMLYSGNLTAYPEKLKQKKQEKLKLGKRVRKYIEYFATTEEPVLSISGYAGDSMLEISKFRLGSLLSFDGMKTDEEIKNEFLEKQKAGEVVVTVTTKKGTVESEVEKFIKECRELIENNFYNKV